MSSRRLKFGQLQLVLRPPKCSHFGSNLVPYEKRNENQSFQSLSPHTCAPGKVHSRLEDEIKSQFELEHIKRFNDVLKITKLYVDKFLNLLARCRWQMGTHTRQKKVRWAVVVWQWQMETQHGSVLFQLFNANFSSNYVVFICIKEMKVNFILTSLNK
jgi:hypothetical protein